MLVSEMSNFGLKRKVLYEFSPKCFKRTESHCLAVFGSLCGEIFFLFIFIPFYLLIQNSCLIKSKFSSEFALFKHGKKNKFLRISVLVSQMSLLSLKIKVLYEFLRKCFKTTERHTLSVCGSLCGVKKFLLIFITFYWFD